MKWYSYSVHNRECPWWQEYLYYISRCLLAYQVTSLDIMEHLLSASLVMNMVTHLMLAWEWWVVLHDWGSDEIILNSHLFWVSTFCVLHLYIFIFIYFWAANNLYKWGDILYMSISSMLQKLLIFERFSAWKNWKISA